MMDDCDAKPERDTHRRGGFIPVGEVVSKLAAPYMDRPQGRARFLTLIWSQVVGERVAQHSQPYRLVNGLLTVRVDSSPWVSELVHMVPRILADIQRAIPGGGVRDLRFVQGSLNKHVDHSEVDANTGKLPPPLPEETAEAARMVAAVSDPQLREVLCKLSQTVLIRRRCG
ncbi:MAG: DUF721 domain-containing protein [Magnetococcales bacterium]|nr:DUF721 domain-containing protein [Magnetococcales bacterium]